MEYSNLNEARIAARSRTYPNSHIERENIRRVDAEVLDRVHEYERSIAGSTDAYLAQHQRHAADAADTITKLNETMFPLAQDPATLDEAISMYDSMRQKSQGMIAGLLREADNAEAKAAIADDPYGIFMDLVNRYPGLHRPIAV